jgi:hypothetical protein
VVGASQGTQRMRRGAGLRSWISDSIHCNLLVGHGVPSFRAGPVMVLMGKSTFSWAHHSPVRSFIK